MIYYHYFKYRITELPIWLGVPLIGFILGNGRLFSKEFLFFLSGAAFFMIHILLFNDWGGLVRNPSEMVRYANGYRPVSIQSDLIIGSMTCLVMSLVIFFVIKKSLIILILTGSFLSFLYSFPAIYWKENPILSKLLHLAGGEIKFLMGYCVISADVLRGVLIGLFYSSVFIAGNLVHECIDLEEDRRGGLKTAAVRFGRRPLMRISWGLFILGHSYLILLLIWNIIEWQIVLLFSFPICVHLFYMFKVWMKTCEVQELVLYRKLYRLAYAICTILFIIR